jgi:hypothetical protein
MTHGTLPSVHRTTLALTSGNLTQPRCARAKCAVATLVTHSCSGAEETSLMLASALKEGESWLREIIAQVLLFLISGERA